MPQAQSIVHVFVSRKSAENGLTEHADERMTTVLPRARIGEKVTGPWSQSKCIIEFAIREQTGIRRNDRSTKLKHHTTVEVGPENTILSFTRRVRHFGVTSSAQITCQL